MIVKIIIDQQFTLIARFIPVIAVRNNCNLEIDFGYFAVTVNLIGSRKYFLTRW